MGRAVGRVAGTIGVSDVRPFTPASRWQQARRAAFVEDALAALARRPSDLLEFGRVSEKLSLSAVSYRDLQTVPLDRIVGSVGRYAEFTRAFLPRSDSLRERWQRVERMVTTRHDMPPVELYKVGELYFVRDGNHRVSVSKQLGRPAIKAYVWEYEAPFPLQPGTDVGSQLCCAARAAFMGRTHLDQLRPEADVRLTEPDGYEDLLREVVAYRGILSRIDARDVPEDEATALWYDMHYLPVLQIIRERGVLDEFPDRTGTDLYLWLTRNLVELDGRYGRRVSLNEAAADLSRRYSSQLPGVEVLKKAARYARRLSRSRLEAWRSFRRRSGPPSSP